jgi:hypothetical protein
MNSTRGALILLGGAAAIPMSMGCITASVMSGGDRETYSETVDSVLLSADANQRISGGYFLRLGKDASPEQKEKALAAGFKPLPTGALTFNSSLNGTRYAANGIQATAASQKLRKTYTIQISAEKSAGAKAASTVGKLLLTPITLAADGVLFIAAIPLILLFVISDASRGGG